MWIRAIGVWLIIMVLAILNGGVREAVITPHLGQQTGHVVSTAILCLLILMTAWLAVAWIGPDSRRDAVLVGAIWIVMTLAFEFLAGHYLFGTPWEELLADYNVFRGRIWPLVPLTTFLAPILAYQARRGR